jgi:hypothetical protein
LLLHYPLAHAREYPGADFKDVVRVNFDTLDVWTDVFATPGTRTAADPSTSW